MNQEGANLHYAFNEPGDILVTKNGVTVTLTVGKAMVPETLVDEARGRGWVESVPPLRVDGLVRMWRSHPQADSSIKVHPASTETEQPR